MLRLSKLTDYATVVMTEMARDASARRSAGDLSARVGLEQPTVAKVLKTLARSGLVQSYRGVQGGYALAEQPEHITMLDIIEAMEGPLGMTECSIHEGLCAQEAICSIRSNWQRINGAVGKALRKITLAEMLAPLPTASMTLHVLPETAAHNTEV